MTAHSGAAGRRLVFLAVGALAILPYLNGLRGDFCFDDPSIVRDNPMVTGPTASARGLLTPVYLGKPYPRPVTMLTYFVNARLSSSPVGYHVVNVILHLLVTLAVLQLAWTLLGSALGGATAGALFAVHPIHTEAVTSIVGRAELLAALCVLLALLASIRAAHRVGVALVGWTVLSWAALAAGILSKESAFAAIPLPAMVYFWTKRTPSPWHVAAVSLVWIGLAFAYLGYRMFVLGLVTLPDEPQILDNPLVHVHLAPRLETALVVLWQYLSQLALPLHLSADYSFNAVPVVSSVRDPQFLGAAVLFTALATLLALNARRAPMLLLAAVFAALPMALTANILFPIGTIKAERLLYLPSVGWCLACGWLITQVPRRRQTSAVTVITLLVVAYAGRTWMRNRDWQNDLTLFAATVQTVPDDAKAQYNLAKAYEDRGRLDAAMQHFRTALAIYPLDADSAFGIGRIYDKQGLENDALNWYGRATELNAGLANAHLNIGLIRYRRGDLAVAEREFHSGLDSEPDNPRLLIGMSLVHAAQGHQDEAEETFKRVEAMAHTDADIPKLLAQARQLLEQKVAR